jgi:hypothetical protein
MFQVITLPEDSDDSAEIPSTNAASVPSLPHSRKSPRHKKASSNAAHHLSNENGHGNTPMADFVVDSEPVDEVEVSVRAHKRQRLDAVTKRRSAKNHMVGKNGRILKVIEATQQDVGSEDAQIADHCEFHKGLIAATAQAASHPMNSDSGQTCQDDSSTNMHRRKPSTSEPAPNASGRRSNVSHWEGRLSELAEYRKIHGNCNVTKSCSKNSKLALWVQTQRKQYRLLQEGKALSMTPSRLQALESLGFKWKVYAPTWEDRLSELAEYRKTHGHCSVPRGYSENTKLATWVMHQRSHYKLHQEGKASPMTTFRIQELEGIGFEWKSSIRQRKEKQKKPSVDDDPTRVRERAVGVPEHVQTTAQNQKDFSGKELPSNQIDSAGEAEESDSSGEVHLGYIPGRTEEI